MKISARNTYPGQITAIADGPIQAEVTVRLHSGEELVAGITAGSAKALGLAPGHTVMAIIKAPLVLLATDTEGWRFTARNQWRGTVSKLERGAVNTSVTLQLPSGISLTSIITNSAVEELNLQPGQAATALFKAGSVILAVED